MNDRKEKFDDRINIQAVNARAPGAAEDIGEAEFAAGHGIVARGKDGEILTKVDGHSYGKEKVDEVIALILED